MGGKTMTEGKDGVPKLIQNLRYRYSTFSFIVTLFDGRELEASPDYFCPSLELTDDPTRMQMLETENRLNKYLIANFKTL